MDIVVGPKWPNLSPRCQPLYSDPFMCVVGSDNRAVPQRLDLEAFAALPHLDVSPSGVGLLRTLIDRALADQGGRRELRTLCSSFLAVPALLQETGLAAVVPRRALALFPPGRVRQLTLDFDLPTYEVSQWWHNVTHADPLMRWVRAQLADLVGRCWRCRASSTREHGGALLGDATRPLDPILAGIGVGANVQP